MTGAAAGYIVGVSWLRSASTLGIAILTAVAAAALAVVATGEAQRFSARLDLEEPLIEIAGEAGAPPPRLTRRVIVILIDGLRLDAARSMSSLAALGTLGVSAVAESHYPTLSIPNYVSLFAGAPPHLSGVRTNQYRGPVPLDSAFARARAAGLRTRYLTGFVSGAGHLFLPALDEAASVFAWPELFERTAAGAIASPDALVVIHVPIVDVAGHEDGADSDEYRAAVAATDDLLARLLARVDLERDTVILVSDHGHIDAGGHGGREEEVVEVPLILAGAGIVRGAGVEHVRLVDVAPTLCALLGIPAPAHAVGRTLVAALTLEAEVAAALAAADTSRATKLERAAAEVAAKLEVRAWLHRGARVIAVAIVMLILLIGLRKLARRGLILLDRRVLILAAPAFPLLFYGLLAVFEPFLSPSMMPEESDAIERLLRYGAVAAALNVLIIWLAVGWRVELRERLAAATAAVLVGLVVALVPAGFAWIVVSPPYAASVPGPTMMMLPSVTFAGVACYAASAVVAIVAEWAVFAARASA